MTLPDITAAAAVAITLAAALYALLRLHATERRLRDRLAELGRQRPTGRPALAIERARWLDDGSDGDPTWYPRALMYGHAPELSAMQRAELAPLFERFDRVMGKAFAHLDTVGVTA